MPALKIYGVPFSQPVRAVLWLLCIKQASFELVPTNPGSKGDSGSRHPDFLEKNPAGTIPTMEDGETGYCLGEAAAIMAYLCQKNGWDDYYPTALEARGQVDWYLNFHHRNIREGSLMVAPKIRKDLNIPEAMQARSEKTFSHGMKTLNDYVLHQRRFIAGDQATIADLIAYGDVGQLQSRYTNIFDFTSYPNMARWLGDMQALPYHDELHEVLQTLGDISTTAPEMDVIRTANVDAMKTLAKLAASF